MENGNKIRGAYASLTGFRRAVPIILFAFALFTGICFIAPGSVGLGKYVADFFKGLFSVGGYFIPFLLMIHAFFYPQDTIKKKTLGRILFSVTVLLFFSAFLHAIKSFNTEMSFAPAEFYKAGKELSGGGFFGGILGYLLMKVFGPVGLIIIAVLIFALYITYFFANGKSMLAKLLLAVLDKISDFFSRFKKKRKDEKREKREEAELKRIEAKAPRISEKHSDLYEDDFFDVNNGLSELKIDGLGINQKKNPRDMELFPKLQDKVLHEEEKPVPETAKTEEPSVMKKSSPLIFSENDYEDKTLEKSIEEPISHIEKDDGFTESADAIFANEFDPFNFASNANLAKRQADNTRNAQDALNEYAEPVKTISKERIDEARRADFEARKKALLEAEARRRAIEEEAEKQRKIEELLREEPSPEKATYTPASGTLYEEPYREGEIDTEPQTVYTAAEPEKNAFTITDMPVYEDESVKEEDEPLVMERTPVSPTYSVLEEEEDKPENNEGFELGFGSSYSDESDTYGTEGDSLNGKESDVDNSSYVESYGNGYDSFAANSDEDYDEEEESFDAGYTGSEDAGELDYETEIPEEERNPDVAAYRARFSALRAEDEAKSEALIVTQNDENDDMEYGTDTVEEQEEDAPVYVPFDMPEVKRAIPKSEPKTEKPKGPDYSNYKTPPIDLLKKGALELDENLNEEITANGEKLIQTLSEFNVRASIRSVDIGPRITRYEIVPAKGVRVNSVINLFDDISLSLASEGIRMEAPIPGKSAIGVEIPNKKSQLVYLRDLIECEEFQSAESKTMACFGKDVTGNVVLGDIEKMPHMLIAGATGMGKSVCMNSIIISMLYRAHPDELKFIMIDPKMVEFNGYNGIPHLLIPVIIDVKQAAGALMWAVEQMEKRYQIFLEHNVRKLEGYNEKVRKNPSLGEPLPKIIIVIDELNDLMLQARKPVEELIMRIAQKARAAGIHLIIGTQRPSVDVITGVIKANIPSRIACKVTSNVDSKTILEQVGAEKLLDKGDMLFWPVGKPKPTRVQGAFVSDGEVERVMEFLKSQSKGSVYDEQALEEINRAAQKCSKGGKGDDDDDGDDDGVGFFNDPQFIEAVELAIKSGKIATSLIQRKIGVGYGRAAKFIDAMEDQGFVSEPNGQKPREVLITRDEWHEILSRRSLD